MSPRFRLVALLGLLLALGCGTNSVPIQEATGVIKFGTKPASNLLIQLTPQEWPEGTKVLAATAVSDDAGRFVLKCDNGAAGAPIGKHKVTLTDNNLNVEGEPKPGDKPHPDRIPYQYKSPSTTPLELVIEAGKNEYEIVVK